MKILYKNWKGEISERNIQPRSFYEGTSQYHPERQWLLDALDLDKGVERTFAVKDILRIGEAPSVDEVYEVFKREIK